MLKGFKDFIMRGNVVDLAVGIVIGAAFSAVVNALVTNIINPLIAAVFGKSDLSKVLAWTLSDGGTPGDPSDDAVLSLGALLDAALTFLLVAGAIYFVIVLPMNALAARRARGQEPPPAAPAEDVRLLTEIRDLLATRD